jgi:hypothetical protein
MKKSFKSLIVYILIIYFVLSLSTDAIKLPANFTYLILTLLILAFTIMISCPLLSFLTVKCKFPTFFLMTSLLLVGVFYSLKLFMIDLYIDQYTFEGVNLGFMQIERFEVIPIISIILFSLSIGFLSTLYRELDTN